jgi:hypothetical protein
LAKEIRPEAVVAVDKVWVAMREDANDGPSTGLLKLKESALSGDHDLSVTT